MQNHFLKYSFIVCLIGCVLSCKKNSSNEPETNPPPTDTAVVIQLPVEPPLAPTIGFFLNGWQPKTFAAPAYTDASIPATAATTITVNPAAVITKIPLTLFGTNANPYMTQLVTEPVLLDQIKNLAPHVIRFPGGNLSSIFFWNADKNVPPADAPDSLVDADGKKNPSNFWYGKNEESWTLSVANYYSMLQQTGSEGIVTVNYSYARYGTSADPVAAAAHLAADWVRYDKGRTKYWEIGNESNGAWQAGYRIEVSKNKDGQPAYINGDLYGKHFIVFADSMRKAAQETGAVIYIGAQLLEKPAESWQTAADKSWNSGVYSAAANTPDYYIVHSYYTPFNTNSDAASILASAPTVTQSIMNYVTTTRAAAGISPKPVALTEWNIFATGSMQMVSHINGVHAVMTLGELLKNKFGLACRWDMANSWEGGNDHGMFSNGDEPGVARWNPRPVFYHMYLFQKLIGDRFVSSSVANNMAIESYASSYTSGQVNLTLVNKSTAAQNLQVAVQNFNMGKRFYWYTATGGADNGEFSRKVFINGAGPSGVAGGPQDYTTVKAFSATTENGIKVSVPPHGVVYLVIDKK